jgi:hypothetical protein
MIMDGMDKNKPGAEDVVDTMLSPEGQQKLAPLADVMREYNWPLGAEKAMVLAQKDPRTAGKTPEELASMMREDQSIYDDLEAMDSGKMDKMKGEMFGGKMPMDAPAEDDATGEVEMPEMGEYLKGSATMQDADPKKASKAAKGKKPGDMDFDQKSAFMSQMAGDA